MGLLPPIVSVLEADITGFMSKMNQAQGKMDEVDKLSVGISKRQVGNTGLGLMAVGGLATGAGAAFLAISDPIEKSQATLQQTIENTGRSWGEYKGRVDDTINAEARYGRGASDTQDALAKLTAAYQDPTKALSEMGLVSDIAGFKHISLSDAAAIDVRMHAGAGKTFKEFGINLKDQANLLKDAEKATKNHETAVSGLEKAQKALSDLEARDAGKKKLTIADQQSLAKAQDNVRLAQDKVNTSLTASQNATDKATTATKNYDKVMHEQLAPRLKGIADAQANTFGGKLDEYKTRVLNMAGALGKNLGPALTVIGPLLMGVGGAMQFFSMVTWEGVGAVWAFLWPVLLVVAAVALLVIGVIYAYTHFKWFRDFVNGAWKEVQILWGWFDKNLLPILGKIAKAVGDFVGKELGDFVKNIQDLTKFVGWLWDKFTGFIGWIASTLKPSIDGIAATFKTVGDAMNSINPFAKHSPSLVENVEAGVEKIRRHYMSLSGMNLAGPSLGGISAGSTAMGLGAFSMAGAGGGAGGGITVIVQGNVLNWNDTAQQLAEPIRAALLQKKRSTGNLGLA